jgi:acyl-CoA reductase-like NAD-dependent aldehyde dehydrogenase
MSKQAMTPQRERFCQEVAKHGNQSEAYRVAYPRALKWAPESVQVSASRLMADAMVSLRVAALRAAEEKKLGMSREKWLSRLADLAGANKPDDVALRALEQIGKALGYYAAQRVEVRSELNIRVVGIEARVAALIAMREAQP